MPYEGPDGPARHGSTSPTSTPSAPSPTAGKARRTSWSRTPESWRCRTWSGPAPATLRITSRSPWGCAMPSVVPAPHASSPSAPERTAGTLRLSRTRSSSAPLTTGGWPTAARRARWCSSPPASRNAGPGRNYRQLTHARVDHDTAAMPPRPGDLAGRGAADEAGNRVEQPFYESAEQGDATSVLLAASPSLEGVTGRCFEDDQEALVTSDGATARRRPGAFGAISDPGHRWAGAGRARAGRGFEENRPVSSHWAARASVPRKSRRQIHPNGRCE
ncbi:hypothetical protein SUDANB178_02712 [Streptomyces sp. enrichment culture]